MQQAWGMWERRIAQRRRGGTLLLNHRHALTRPEVTARTQRRIRASLCTAAAGVRAGDAGEASR